MFSSTSFAGWTSAYEGNDGNIVYVDFERIRKVDGFVYYWELFDFLKPITQGILSTRTYIQGDCKLFRSKYLSISAHKEPMGGGTGEIVNTKNPEWDYPTPNSSVERILKSVCSR
jgi:hypothetical protein